MESSGQRVLGLLGAALLVLVGVYFWYIFHRGELADKPYWAALQSVGSFFAMPLVADGTVFIGSADSNVYAIE